MNLPILILILAQVLIIEAKPQPDYHDNDNYDDNPDLYPDSYPGDLQDSFPFSSELELAQDLSQETEQAEHDLDLNRFNLFKNLDKFTNTRTITVISRNYSSSGSESGNGMEKVNQSQRKDQNVQFETDSQLDYDTDTFKQFKHFEDRNYNSPKSTSSRETVKPGTKDHLQIQNIALKKENSLRALHNLYGYELDPELSQGAQIWAAKTAKKCPQFVSTALHSLPSQRKYNGTEAGESISFSTHNVHDNTISEMDMVQTYINSGIQDWYDEKDKYDCGRVLTYTKYSNDDEAFQYFSDVGHYMATMSKKTKLVGYGFYLADCPQGDFAAVTVARYYPAITFKGRDNDIQKDIQCPN